MTAVRTAAMGAATLSMSASCTQLPEPPAATQAVWLEQNWTPAQRQWFHHCGSGSTTSARARAGHGQGTATLPVPHECFMAFEQAGLRPFGTPALFQ